MCQPNRNRLEEARLASHRAHEAASKAYGTAHSAPYEERASLLDEADRLAGLAYDAQQRYANYRSAVAGLDARAANEVLLRLEDAPCEDCHCPDPYDCLDTCECHYCGPIYPVCPACGYKSHRDEVGLNPDTGRCYGCVCDPPKRNIDSDALIQAASSAEAVR